MGPKYSYPNNFVPTSSVCELDNLNLYVVHDCYKKTLMKHQLLPYQMHTEHLELIFGWSVPQVIRLLVCISRPHVFQKLF